MIIIDNTEIKVGSKVIYEGRECIILEMDDDQVLLENLSKSNDKDWKLLRIELRD